ncbi:MAG: metal-sulfur cluster assembly factor [Armatimonadota bacterium]
MWSEEDIREALKDVYDPEFGISIVDLGLVYGIDVAGDRVTVRMTLTSPACPLGPEIIETVKSVLGALPMVKQVDVELVWTPRWDPQKMASEEAKMELGIY